MATTTALPPAAAAAATAALTEAMAAASISSTSLSEPEVQSIAADPAATEGENKADEAELEDGEIREEEDDGRVRTVFDDVTRFNVKVGFRRIRGDGWSARGPRHVDKKE
jgi:hypothetical protein